MIGEALRRNSAAAVIVISGTGDIEKAVRATKMGACQFIEKPFSLEDVRSAIEQALGDTTCARQRVRVDEEGVRIEGPGWTLIGLSNAMKEIYRQILMVSRNPQAAVLIQGESGTGKELVARAVYANGNPSGGAFVDVNCAALSESLLEAELFGHEKGAFTGAGQMRKGLFEAAHGGAIFLDEIGEMPLRLQSKLLRVLEEKTFKRVGGVENIHVDFRVIASTNRNLREMVEEGAFRRDLYYRLEVFTILVPPLRERPEDVPPLSAYFLERSSRECNKRFSGFSREAMDRLTAYAWPGNVRELRNVVERAVILGSGGVIEARDLILADGAAPPGAPPETPPLRAQSLECMERALIQRVLDENGWHKAKAAEILGINRTTLWQKIKRYGLQPEKS